MAMEKAQPVASVCFLDNRSISMDIENVHAIESGVPMRLGENEWFCELLIRTATGTVALQMLADHPDRFFVRMPDAPAEE
jgi:hypothetical protein